MPWALRRPGAGQEGQGGGGGLVIEGLGADQPGAGVDRGVDAAAAQVRATADVALAGVDTVSSAVVCAGGPARRDTSSRSGGSVSTGGRVDVREPVDPAAGQHLVHRRRRTPGLPRDRRRTERCLHRRCAISARPAAESATATAPADSIGRPSPRHRPVGSGLPSGSPSAGRPDLARLPQRSAGHPRPGSWPAGGDRSRSAGHQGGPGGTSGAGAGARRLRHLPGSPASDHDPPRTEGAHQPVRAVRLILVRCPRPPPGSYRGSHRVVRSSPTFGRRASRRRLQPIAGSGRHE